MSTSTGVSLSNSLVMEGVPSTDVVLHYNGVWAGVDVCSFVDGVHSGSLDWLSNSRGSLPLTDTM